MTKHIKELPCNVKSPTKPPNPSATYVLQHHKYKWKTQRGDLNFATKAIIYSVLIEIATPMKNVIKVIFSLLIFSKKKIG